jgi:mono/diheme cytochrome c family protein
LNRLLFALALALLAAAGARAAEMVPSYTRDIKPLLENYCVHCHKPGKAKAGVDLSTYTAMLRGSKKGKKIVIPGQPHHSTVQHTMDGGRPSMPPRREKQMKEEEIELVRAWIKAGAKNDAKKP